MRDKVVLITGVAGGIGSAAARLFNKAGWHVIGIDLHRERIEDFYRFIQADVSDTQASQKLFDEVAKKENRIDALINNAAIQICKPLVETTPEEWDTVIASNLRSVFLTVRHAYPLMKARGGSIINISSVHAIATSPNIASYAASKGAVSALTRAMAIELSSDQIRVNAILPGAIDTAMLENGLKRNQDPEVAKQDLIEATPLKRIGNPEDVANLALFLSDDSKSGNITGQDIVCDGGVLAKLASE